VAAPIDRRVQGRTTDLPGDGSGIVSHLTMTGGPLQPRGRGNAASPFATEQTPFPYFPTNDPVGYNRYNNGAGSTEPLPTQVAQDILDPLVRQIVPATPPATPTEGEPFTYPVLWVTTESGQLHEISSNIEGEDLSTVSDAFFQESGALGWAFVTDQDRRNLDHVSLDRFIGPGGRGGAVVVTSAYFPGLDPNFRNPYVAGPEANPTAPAYQKEDVPDAGGGVPPVIQLRPRPLRGAIEAQAPDDSTGDAGFPLDGNGLFFDPESTLPVNQTGTVRLPFERGVDPTPTAPFGPNIDVNPLGSYATWVIAGGPDGVLYAYTPVPLGTSTGGAPGVRDRTGGLTGRRPEANGDPKVDIFDEDVFNRLLAAAQGGTPIRPDRDGSITGNLDTASRTARGRNNFFEWGETINVVAYDLERRHPEHAGKQSGRRIV
jgi:hypothetical protein